MSQPTSKSYAVEDYLALEDYLLLDQTRLFYEYYHRLEPAAGSLTTKSIMEKTANSEAVRVEVTLRQITRVEIK